MNRAMLSNNFPWIWANYHIFQSWIKVPTKHETTLACPMFPISLQWPGRLPNASLEQFHHRFNFFHGFFLGFEDFLYLTNRLAQPFGISRTWIRTKTMHYVSEDIPKQCFSTDLQPKRSLFQIEKQKFSLKILYKPKTLDARCIFHTTRHIYTEGSDTTN